MLSLPTIGWDDLSRTEKASFLVGMILLKKYLETTYVLKVTSILKSQHQF